jgi:hypothetical protein
MSTKRYLQIDSTYRNREMFENPSQFNVLLSQTGKKSNAIDAYDPIAKSYPFYPTPPLSPPLPGVPTLPTFASQDTGTMTVDLVDSILESLSPIENFYINTFIERISTVAPYETIEYRKILHWNGITKVATIESNFTSDPSGDFYRLRRSTPIDNGTLVGGTSTTFTLPATASSESGVYVGQFVWIKSGIELTDPFASDIRIVTAYDGITRIGTVNTAFTTAVAGAGILYEILHFTDDNVCPLTFTGSIISQKQTSCYEIELISLILPNTILQSGYGNRIAFYPYVYVEFANLSAASGQARNIIYSNNPNATRALFIAPIDDINEPTNSTFVSIDSHGMVETVKFKPNDNFRFSVFLPSGELFTTTPDTSTPLPPDPNLQISAVFSILKLG